MVNGIERARGQRVFNEARGFDGLYRSAQNAAQVVM